MELAVEYIATEKYSELNSVRQPKKKKKLRYTAAGGQARPLILVPSLGTRAFLTLEILKSNGLGELTSIIPSS